MASDVKSAAEAWQAAVEGLEASTKAVTACLKMLDKARTNDSMNASWSAVLAAREAMLSYQEAEAEKFQNVDEFQRQESMDFEGKAKPKPKGEAVPEGKDLPQIPLALPAASNAAMVEATLPPAIEEDEIDRAFDEDDTYTNDDEDEEPDDGTRTDDEDGE